MTLEDRGGPDEPVRRAELVPVGPPSSMREWAEELVAGAVRTGSR
jgi:hypothetical protein